MSTIKTLDSLSELKETGFGQPDPRHGLRLLWWFSRDCVRIDGNNRMIAQRDPTAGTSGFHQFLNKKENNSGRLLPYCRPNPYYEVGNLNRPNSFPPYVTENYTNRPDNSNKDRIIVSYNTNLGTYDVIYVTQHLNQREFDRRHTYRISQSLMSVIQGLSLQEFLQETQKTDETANNNRGVYVRELHGCDMDDVTSDRHSLRSCCCIL